MKPLQVIFLAVVLAAAAVFVDPAGAQAPQRVRGTIAAINGDVLSVKSREGKDLRIELAPNTTFSYMKKLNIADVKPGTAMVEAGNGRELTLSYKDGVRPPQ